MEKILKGKYLTTSIIVIGIALSSIYLVYFYSQPSGVRIASVSGVFPLQDDTLEISIFYRKDHPWEKDFSQRSRKEGLKLKLIYGNGNEEIFPITRLQKPHYWNKWHPVSLYEKKVKINSEKNTVLHEIVLKDENNKIIDKTSTNLILSNFEANYEDTAIHFASYELDGNIDISLSNRTTEYIRVEEIINGYLDKNNMERWKYIKLTRQVDGRYSQRDRECADVYNLTFPLSLEPDTKYILFKELTPKELIQLKQERAYFYTIVKAEKKVIIPSGWSIDEPKLVPER
ncbi:MAG: hypothetical protein JJT76_04695 [Clostridiaceae bacterium]|nr:hypothetical protein [Clostridiaceae bacterium]